MVKQRLGRADWIEAALDALARGGVAAVRVEVLAKQLAVTRGSFYWHFADRDALLAAALEEWERTTTIEVVERLNDVTSPPERLRAIFEIALFTQQSPNRIEPALATEADHPVIAPVLRRVTTARLSFLTELFTDLGLDPDTARQRALYAYSAFLGWLQLRRTMPDLAPETTHEGRLANAFVDNLTQALTAGARDTTPGA
ncbi:TetR/AcrR family transcriptional regulator [Actinomadura barringtoniae]|uniref:TetR/AcrR family transcriptional regulator n=1 Tax=Actinomadura barringtoniae TaxID=1427535 RepID=A0A939PJH6_9ACTN|nr:TetR/AcrR family transcriptional regulator [Actinomadura barringtoniae]MBO2453437.1 TetR/AcrR family transcriptional regulator [Actinomadura barringtoniae]